LPQLVRLLSVKEAYGQMPTSWSDLGFYLDKIRVIQNACAVLSSPSRQPEDPSLGAQRPSVLPGRTVLEFDVDVAKALIVMASIVYERDDDYVRLASQFADSGGPAYLLRSEELMVCIHVAELTLSGSRS
jgi:hypothetical protein